MAKVFTYGAASLVVFALIKDGTFQTLVTDAANFIKHGATGIKPLVNQA